MHALKKIGRLARLSTHSRHSKLYRHSSREYRHTVSGERFAGLNFCVFHSFQEYHESFSMNINALSLIRLNNEYLWPRQRENIP